MSLWKCADMVIAEPRFHDDKCPLEIETDEAVLLEGTALTGLAAVK